MHVYASGWKTARVVVLLFEYGGWVGWGGIKTFMWLAYTRDATLLLRQWLGVGWGGVGEKRSCDLRTHVMLRCCYVSGWGLGGVGSGKNVHVTSQQLPSLASLHLTARQVFVPLVLWNVCSRPTSMVAKASWWQTVPHATLNWPLKIICFMKLAIIVRASFASRRERNGVPCLCTPVVSMECGFQRCSIKFLEHT